MNKQTSRDELGPKIIKALGLPKYVTRLELIFEGSKPILVRCESLAWVPGTDADDAAKEFAEYELRKVSTLPPSEHWLGQIEAIRAQTHALVADLRAVREELSALNRAAKLEAP